MDRLSFTLAALLIAGASEAATVVSVQSAAIRGDGVISDFIIRSPRLDGELSVPEDIQEYSFSGGTTQTQTLSTTFAPFDPAQGQFLGAELQYLYGSGSTQGAFIGGSSVISNTGFGSFAGGNIEVETSSRLSMTTPGGTFNARRVATWYLAATAIKGVDRAGATREVRGGAPGNSISIAGFGVGRAFGAGDVGLFLNDPTFDLRLDFSVNASATCDTAQQLLTKCSARVSGTYGGPVSATLTYVYDQNPVPPAVVPLPAGLPLALSAFGILGLIRLRRCAPKPPMTGPAPK